jgi:hypothetical protein
MMAALYHFVLVAMNPMHVSKPITYCAKQIHTPDRFRAI